MRPLQCGVEEIGRRLIGAEGILEVATLPGLVDRLSGGMAHHPSRLKL
jgi:hypothetical protein